MGIVDPGFPARMTAVRGEEMLQPEEVAAMMRLHALGWGAKRLSKEFGCARNTVRRYLRAGGATPFSKPVRRSVFDGLDEWLRERFFRHGGNADVVRQELASEHGIVIGIAVCREAGPGLATGVEGAEACDGALRDAAGPPAAD